MEERERKEIQKYVISLRWAFHLPHVIRLVTDQDAGRIDRLPRHAVAWYDPTSDIISLNLDKVLTEAEHKKIDILEVVGQCIFHEAIGHYGLRLLLGYRFEQTMCGIYDYAHPALWEKLEDMRHELEDIKDARGHFLCKDLTDTQMKVLTVDEYISSLAEAYHSFLPVRHGIIRKLADAMGFAMFRLSFPFHKVTEKDIRQLLEYSYRNVRRQSLLAGVFERLADRFPSAITDRLYNPFRKHTLQATRTQEKKETESIVKASVFPGMLKAFLTLSFPFIMVPYLLVRSAQKREKRDAVPMSGGRKRAALAPVACEVLNALDAQSCITPRDPLVNCVKKENDIKQGEVKSRDENEVTI